MGILRVDHPDIVEFITCKKNNADITNFNISVGITEEFMNAVENNEFTILLSLIQQNSWQAKCERNI